MSRHEADPLIALDNQLSTAAELLHEYRRLREDDAITPMTNPFDVAVEKFLKEYDGTPMREADCLNGPCIRSAGHGGPHFDSNGEQWV